MLKEHSGRTRKPYLYLTSRRYLKLYAAKITLGLLLPTPSNTKTKQIVQKSLDFT